MMEKTFWLSYDVSLGSDLDGLYRWLDEHQAEECGFGVATFKRVVETNDPATELRESLKQRIQFGKNDRIYMIWKEDHTGRNRGEFIIGGRKGAPWKGYALQAQMADFSE